MRINWTKEMLDLRDKIELLYDECEKIKRVTYENWFYNHKKDDSKYKELKINISKLRIELNVLATKENPEWCKHWKLTQMEVWV